MCYCTLYIGLNVYISPLDIYEYIPELLYAYIVHPRKLRSRYRGTACVFVHALSILYLQQAGSVMCYLSEDLIGIS